MNKKYLLYGLIGLFVIQLAVPVYMIFKQEYIAKAGQEYLFRCLPVDPIHPLMGRYVQLNFSNLEGIPLAKGELFQEGKKAYVTFDQDDNGFVRLKEMTYLLPKEPYITVYKYWMHGVTPLTIQVSIPFSQYYMDEGLAPLAERELWKITQQEDIQVYAKVKLLAGKGLLDSVYVNGTRLEEFVNEKLHQK